MLLNEDDSERRVSVPLLRPAILGVPWELSIFSKNHQVIGNDKECILQCLNQHELCLTSLGTSTYYGNKADAACSELPV